MRLVDGPGIQPTAVLNTIPFGFSKTGSVVMNNSLVVSGFSENFSTSFELVSPNRRPKRLTVQLPWQLYRHCMVKWDSETFMVIGGRQRIKKNGKIESRMRGELKLSSLTLELIH